MNMGEMVSYLKFFIKWRAAGVLRSLLLYFFGRRPNIDGWKKRVLVINLNALGDVVVSSSVLRQFKYDFPEKEIYFLFPRDIGDTETMFGRYADKILSVDLKKFSLNPLYALSFINRLRDIGFATVVNLGLSISEIPSKIIAINLCADRVIGYEGLGVQFENAISYTMKQGVAFVEKYILPHYTKVVRAIDRDFRTKGTLANFMSHYAAIYGAFLERAPRWLPTVIGVDVAAEKKVGLTLKERGITSGKYCVLVAGARATKRRWPLERFAEVAREIVHERIPIVLAGTTGEKELAPRFKEISGINAVDMIGEFSLPELVALIKNSLFVFTNDTAPAHLAVALKKPSLCVVGAAHLGMISLYGYPGLNRWVYDKNAPCLFDDWRCALTVSPGSPAPCLAMVTPEMATRTLRELLATIRNPVEVSKLSRQENFQVQFRDIPKLQSRESPSRENFQVQFGDIPEVSSPNILHHLFLFVNDLRCIVAKERGIKNRYQLLFTHLRIKLKQIILRILKIKTQREHVLGMKISFPDYEGFFHLWREIFISENYYFKTDNKQPAIVDLGSNIGMSICFFKYLYPGSTIVGFEPDPEAFRWLKINIEANNFKNVTLHNAAVGAVNGTISFYEHPTEAASGLNSARANSFGSVTPIEIKVKSEKFSDTLNKDIDLLKIDTEGGEYEIFKDIVGANKLRYAKEIFLELHQGRGIENDPIAYVLDALEKNNFRYAITGTFIDHNSFLYSPLKAYALMLDAIRE